MREYYMVEQLAVNPIKPALVTPDIYPYLMSQENFDKVPENVTGYYECKEEVELPGVLIHPTFMLQTQVKEVVELYDATIDWKTFTLLPNELEKMKKATELYWLPNLKRYQCIHKDSVIMPTGSIEKLILDADKIPNVDIFQVDQLVMNKVIVSLRLAESINRRNIYGIGFTRVNISEGRS